MAEFSVLNDEFFFAVVNACSNVRAVALEAGHSVVYRDEAGRYVEERPGGHRFQVRFDHVVVIKGDSRAAALLGDPAPIEIGLGAKIKRGVKVWPVNSGMAKEELYRWLRLERPTDEDLEKGVSFPPGYCHFPRYSEEYFKQITAEQLVTKIVKGYRRHEWQKMRERNEALDCRVYARAAASRIGLDRYRDKHWQAIEDRMGVPKGPEKPSPSAPAGSRPQPQPRPRGSRRRTWGRF